MSIRQRPTSSKPPSTSDDEQAGATGTASSPASPSPVQGAVSRTLTSTANLANLLPTGTLLAFQILTPVFTNNGACDPTTRLLTVALLLLLAASCLLACFTDSVKASDGRVYHGLATLRGMWLFEYPDEAGSGLPDLSKYRVRAIDWVHAGLSVLVFGAVALRDTNVERCLYPSPGVEIRQVLDIVPLGIGVICSFLFVVFPTTRHGVGYPVTPAP